MLMPSCPTIATAWLPVAWAVSPIVVALLLVGGLIHAARLPRAPRRSLRVPTGTKASFGGRSSDDGDPEDEAFIPVGALAPAATNPFMPPPLPAEENFAALLQEMAERQPPPRPRPTLQRRRGPRWR